MIKSMMKFRILFVLALMLQLVAVPLHSFAADSDKSNQIDYLALGDSLAFGVNSDDEAGEGYTDFVALAMQSTGVLKSFNKGFSARGYTSTQVLNDLKDNVTKPVLGVGNEEETAQLHASIEGAEIITLTVGANDVISNISFNLETGKPVFDLVKITASIKQVGINYNAIISSIHAINPDAQVYVMGYYNPFPHIPDVHQDDLDALLDGLNNGIQAGIFGTNSLFVPTADAIAADFIVNLPNPQNIHLSDAGHKVVAELFNSSMLENYPWDPTKETPPTFSDIDSSGFKEYIEQSVALGLIYGHTDGTFKPNDNLTRGQAAAIIARGLKLKTDEKAPFTDIGNYSKVTQAEIAAAYKYKIVVGSNGKFNPSDSVTRGQLALMLKRAYEVATAQPYIPAELAPFTDYANYNTETKHAITMLYDLNIADGSNGKFMPNDPTTRGQAAKMFVNFTGYLLNLANG